jgi:hypothetical protein
MSHTKGTKGTKSFLRLLGPAALRLCLMPAFLLLLSGGSLFALVIPRVEQLVAALRPALPFPSATPEGELPADNSAQSKWFVVWPTEPDTSRVVVKANPLHPDTQKAGAEAMDRINAAVAAAERKAQAAYDKALEDLRRTGAGSTIDTITLDDEGVAGERIDAELELTIDLQPAASFEIATSEAPAVTSGTRGATWRVHVPANAYRRTTGADVREHFRPAETRLYFGALTRPDVTRKGAEPLFAIRVTPTPDSFAVVLRGNEGLIKQLVSTVDWSALTPR